MITATITGAEETAAKFRAAGPKVVGALLAAMSREVQSLRDYIVAEKLRSGSPLHSQTGHLIASTIDYVEQEGQIVTGVVGVDRSAAYGKVHEYGGTFDIPEHISHSASGKEFTVRAHQATFPERSFLRVSLAEQEEAIVAKLRAAVYEAMA